MSWTLQKFGPSSLDAQKYTLQDGNTSHMILRASDGTVRVVHEQPDPEKDTILGQITVVKKVAKLEAITGHLFILPGPQHLNTHSRGLETRHEAYLLSPRKNGNVDILLLRDGDVISSNRTGANFTCTWIAASEVQVNSSAAETEAQKQVDGADGVTNAPEDETEDEDLDQTSTTIKATQTKSQQPTQPQPTPQLSEQRSIVVQETPTTVRFGAAVDYLEAEKVDMEQARPVENTPTPEVLGLVGAQTYSTARTGQSQQGSNLADASIETPNARARSDVDQPSMIDTSILTTDEAPSAKQRGKRGPKVVIAKKRANPALGENESDTEHIDRSNKRAKRNPVVDDNTQDSVSSNIVVDTSPAATSAKKGRGRKSAVKDLEEFEEGTPGSQRSSQRSASAVIADSYSGETPFVAISNSAITDTTYAAKFLKKQGGSLTNSVKDAFNILCIRDGELKKAPKVLQAIAAGVPMVTDKWLIDSAKAGHLLSLDTYKPQAPKQEEEWNFKLDNVLGRPQTPFQGYILHFTTDAHASYISFPEIEYVCQTAGAEKITAKKKIGKKGKIIVIASETGDEEAEKFAQDGVPCYYRGILPMSIFRGTFELDSEEFKFGSDVATASTAKESGTKAKRGRKS